MPGAFYHGIVKNQQRSTAVSLQINAAERNGTAPSGERP
jgi:hypothetical protein